MRVTRAKQKSGLTKNWLIKGHLFGLTDYGVHKPRDTSPMIAKSNPSKRFLRWRAPELLVVVVLLLEALVVVVALLVVVLVVVLLPLEALLVVVALLVVLDVLVVVLLLEALLVVVALLVVLDVLVVASVTTTLLVLVLVMPEVVLLPPPTSSSSFPLSTSPSSFTSSDSHPLVSGTCLQYSSIVSLRLQASQLAVRA